MAVSALAALDEPLFDNEEQLMDCITAVKNGTNVHLLYEAYVVLGYWYAQAKADVRVAKRSSDEYREAKRREDILEGLVLSAKEGIQLVKHLNRKEMADY